MKILNVITNFIWKYKSIILAFGFLTLALTFGFWAAWNTFSKGLLDRLGALGSWIGGITALLALFLAMIEYHKRKKLEALQERFELAKEIVPKLHTSFILLLRQCIVETLRLKNKFLVDEWTEISNTTPESMKSLQIKMIKNELFEESLTLIKRFFDEYDKDFKEFNKAKTKLSLYSPNYFNQIHKEVDFITQLNNSTKFFRLIMSEELLGKGSLITLNYLINLNFKLSEENELKVILNEVIKPKESESIIEFDIDEESTESLSDLLNNIRTNLLRIESKLN